MQHTVLQPLTPARKALLAGVAAYAIIAPVLIGITRVPSALAQSAAPAPTGAALSFDVASVKPANPEARGTRIMMTPGGGLTVSNAPVKGLIGMAYDVREFQISGGPSWITSERYDITAKTENGGAAPSPGPPDPARMKQMRDDMQQRLRSLLADRFQLAAHKETKEMPAYVLTVAKNGPKLKAAADPSPGKGMIRMQRGQLNVQSANLDMLVRSLSNELGRPVVDQTGLTGIYDFDLKWVPEMASGPSGMGGPPEAAPAGDASGPSIFTALQEQLGLKLESHKAPAEIIVIDRIEKPSAN